MNEELEKLLAELEAFGEANDRNTGDRARRMLNITRDTGEFLAVMVRATGARRILEIGTSNGYSTLWLADAARAAGGHVTTVELSDEKRALATETFRRAAMESLITLVAADAGELLASIADAAYDLIFLDAERTAYPDWWSDLKRVIKRGGLLVVDNAASHAEQMAPLVALVEGDPEFTSCLVPVGKGEFLAVRGA